MWGAFRDLGKIWQMMNTKRFDNIMFKTKTVSARALPEGIEVRFNASEEGETPPRPARCTTRCCKPWSARPKARRWRLRILA